MNRIDLLFQRLTGTGERALVCYFPLGDSVGGDPLALADRYVAAGVDVLEMGLPWQDPILDGPTIRGSMQRALAMGTTPARFFDEVRRIRRAYPDLPLEVMTYQGLVDSIGAQGFSRMCAELGVDAVIVPDASRHQRREMDLLLRPLDIHPLRFAPFELTPQEITEIAQEARGFVFVQAKPGVTGAGTDMHAELHQNLVALRSGGVRTPLVAGFGMSLPEQVLQANRWGADGVVVGSAAVEHLVKSGEALSEFLCQMKQATRPVSLAR